MSERIKSQDLKNVLPENTKDHIVKSLQNELDMCACAYYFTEILKDPSIYTYEDDYGAHKSVSRSPSIHHIVKAKMDLALNKYLTGAWVKVKSLSKTYGKNDLDDRRFYHETYKDFWSGKFRNKSIIHRFNNYISDAICLIYMYRKSIPAMKLKVLEKNLSDDMLIDFVNVMSIMEEKIKVVSWLFKLTKNRNPISPGDVYYKGKKYSLSELGRISSNLKKAVQHNIEHSQNFSNYVYNYSSVIDVPIIISPLIADTGSEGGYVAPVLVFEIFSFDVKKSKRFMVDVTLDKMVLKTSYMSLTPIIARRDTAYAIASILAHEGTHVWQLSTERKYPKRWKRFENSWTRYFNELNRLRFKPNQSSKVSLQQREDFVDGLSDYIKVKKLKKSYQLEILNTGKKYRFPTYEALSNMLLLMIAPSHYSLTDSWELMAETIQFIAIGGRNDLGFDIDSDVPTFFVPAKRFLKLIQKYDLDK